MNSITRDVDVLKGKVLDQRVNFDNMADRVIALEDHVDTLIDQNTKLIKLTDSLVKLMGRQLWVLRLVTLIKKY